MKVLMWIVGLPVAAVVLLMLIGLVDKSTGSSTSQSPERRDKDVVAQCYADADRTQNANMRSMCNGLYEKFVSTYKRNP